MQTPASLPRACRRLVLVLAAWLLGLATPVPSFAQACTGDPLPQIFLRNPIVTINNPAGLTRAFASALSYTVHAELSAGLGGRVNVVWEEAWASTSEAARLQMLLGADTEGNSILNNQVLPQAATDWLMLIQLRPDVDGIRRQMVLTLFDTRRGRVERQRSAALPADNAAVPAVLVAEVRAFAQGLDCRLRLARGAPVQPQVRIAVEPTPPRGQTGDNLTVRATLVDLANNAAPVANQRLTVHYLTPQGVRTSRWATTDANGVATDTFVLGEAHPRAGLIEAGFRDIRGIERKSQQMNYYVRPPGGQLALATGKAQLVPGGADTVTAALGLNATPVAAAAVTLNASAGAVGSASTDSTRVVTNSAGLAAVPYVAPSVPSLVDLRASATLPASGDTTSTSVSYVVDPGVVITLAAGGDTVILGASSLRVDLEREQRAVAGATVEFSVVGGGTLSAATATTDSVGRAEAAFSAPSRAGASTITARVTLDGQTYSRSVTVRYADALDSITREIADVKAAMYLDPSDATLSRLATLRGVLLARGEDGRAESLLGDNTFVMGPLSCVHQRAHDECAAGARTRAEPTLGLLKRIASGSGVLDYLYSRARDSLRVCPYTPFVNGSVYVPDATIGDIVFTHTVGLYFSISSWDADDRPGNFYFDARDESGTINRFVRGTVPVAGPGPSYSATIADGDLFNLWGNRFLMLDHQRRATASTVSISINGTQVSGVFNLYRGEYEGVQKTAFVSFNTTVTPPAAPNPAMCDHASLPRADGN
ncbi:MAG: hypothetical protein KF683_02075 [Rubrivivax sp.]|nr:hypothetical protein [Rubrivivax sp.]